MNFKLLKACDRIISFVSTEKSISGTDEKVVGVRKKYRFKIAPDATKQQVKQGIETLFKVNVEKVNVLNRKGSVRVFKGRKGRTSDSKIAIVTLKESQQLDLEVRV